MADRLRVHPLVVGDVRAATKWYDKISLELGNRFRASVNARLDDIEAASEPFAIAFDDVHFARIQ